MDLIEIGIYLGCLIAGFSLFWFLSRQKLISDIKNKESQSESIISSAKNRANKIIKDTEKKARNYKENQMKKVKQEIDSLKKDIDSRTAEVNKKEKELDSSLKDITRKEAQVEMRESSCEELMEKYRERETELEKILEDAKTKIESIAGLSRDDAKEELIKTVENEAKIISARRIKEIEKDMQDDAERKSKNIIALAIQKYAASYTSEKTASVVNLPSDDMKGRIIGKEGRNIRTIELKTGVDIIIDDTPGVVTVSSHNPLRREIASRAIKKLLDDGRVHPGRIEEIVEEIESQLGKELRKLGDDAILELGLSNMHPDLVTLVGRMKYRTSYSQNILDHSLEIGRAHV